MIDSLNETDETTIDVGGKRIAKELIYGRRMSSMLYKFVSDPSDALQIATRGQHIKRWMIVRRNYPIGKAGYYEWRTAAGVYHAKLLTEVLISYEASPVLIDRVVELVTKRNLKSDMETQQLEDVACLVFLKYYFSDFAKAHEEEKTVSIVKKTWSKMSDKAKKVALTVYYDVHDLHLIQSAITND